MDESKEDFQKQQPQSMSLYQRFRAQIDLLGEACGINGKIMFIIIIVCLVSVFIGYFENIITNCVGIIYPAYWSIKAIETKHRDDDKQWLTYWVVFSLFILFESFFGFVIKYIPFYVFLKLILLLWLFLPNYRGANRVYDNLIIKCFKKYEVQIEEGKAQFEEGLKTTYESEKDTIKELQQTNSELYRKAMENAMNTSRKFATTSSKK